MTNSDRIEIKVIDCRWQFITSISQESRANGKDGVNGPNVQLRAARGLKSGLEPVAEALGRVQGILQRPETALWLSVQVAFSAEFQSLIKHHYSHGDPWMARMGRMVSLHRLLWKGCRIQSSCLLSTSCWGKSKVSRAVHGEPRMWLGRMSR